MALCSFSAWIGLSIGDPEAVQAAVFIPILPLVFTSSAFAPVSRLPGWMQPLARANPVTAAIDLARGSPSATPSCTASAACTPRTALWHFALWWMAIVVVFTGLAVRRYRRG